MNEINSGDEGLPFEADPRVKRALQTPNTRDLLIITYGELGHIRESLGSLLGEFRRKTEDYDGRIRALELCGVRTDSFSATFGTIEKRLADLENKVILLGQSLATEKGTQRASHHWIDYLIMAAISAGIALLVSLVR